MKTAKFWLVQIVMVAIVSLVLGSPVFAGPDGDPSGGKRQGAQTDNDNNSNGVAKSNGAARGFVPDEEPPAGEGGDEDDDDGGFTL
jgi:hypothetical protein